jgi:hypothetical protein
MYAIIFFESMYVPADFPGWWKASLDKFRAELMGKLEVLCLQQNNILISQFDVILLTNLKCSESNENQRVASTFRHLTP